MNREGAPGEQLGPGSELNEEWVLVDFLGDHPGWEAEAERFEQEVRQIAKEVGAGFFVFQNCPPGPNGTPRLRIIAYSTRLKDAYFQRNPDRGPG